MLDELFSKFGSVPVRDDRKVSKVLKGIDHSVGTPPLRNSQWLSHLDETHIISLSLCLRLYTQDLSGPAIPDEIGHLGLHHRHVWRSPCCLS